jgi:hypothetical protein
MVSIVINLYFGYTCVLNAHAQLDTTSEYVPYRPIFANTRRYYKSESLFMVDTSGLNEKHIENLQKVLKYYRHEYKLEGSKLLVKRVLWEDKEYMANMTSKANDEQWLNSRQALPIKK